MAEANELLSSLRRKRGAIKAKLTNLERFVKSIEEKRDAAGAVVVGDERSLPAGLEPQELAQLRNRLSMCPNLLAEYEEFHFRILEYEDIDLDLENSAYDEFQTAYFNVITKAKMLSEPSKLPERPVSPASEFDRISIVSAASRATSGSRRSRYRSSSRQRQGIKLPELQLPTFDGNYDDWLEFRDSFASLIHENKDIPNLVDKFQYLKASLTGSAAKAILSIKVSAGNYSQAWNALLERYENPRMLVKQHVKLLFNVEQMSKATSASLRNLVDTYTKNLNGLQMLELDVKSWDPLLVHMITSKLDTATKHEWEKGRVGRTTPTYAQLREFLRSRIDYLESLEDTKPEKKSHSTLQTRLLTSSVRYPCIMCKGDHFVQNCPTFLPLSVNDRIAKVKGERLCVNCLKPGHFAKTCKSGHCRKCSAKHNTMLHIDTPKLPVEGARDDNSKDTLACMSSGLNLNGVRVLLPTVCIWVNDHEGKVHQVRALLDSGSQSSYISKNLVNRLKLPTNSISMVVGSLYGANSSISSYCHLRISSMRSKFSAETNFLVIPRIAGSLPNFIFDKSQLDIPSHLHLADPFFAKPGDVDLLIGAELIGKLYCVGRYEVKGGPVLQNTVFGWILSGPVDTLDLPTLHTACNFTQILEQQVSRFWEIEEGCEKRPFTQEEAQCETEFVKTTFRDDAGRFVVTLPLREHASVLGESRMRAERCLVHLEKRFERNPPIRERYVNFLSEYQVLGHMTKVNEDLESDEIAYYLPHHAVVNDTSLTTKLRVVFNASAPSSTGASLNQLLMVGPTIQEDLFAILVRFRRHNFVMSADIEKMYRQVLVNSSQRSLQRILWRWKPLEPISAYDLNTVTYGTAAASFLAIRCLYQLAEDCKERTPEISRIIEHDFYVDDLLTGASTIEEAKDIVKGVTRVLSSACMPLRKWVANDPQILDQVPTADRATHIVDLSPDDIETKLLGMRWKSRSDQFCYSIDLPRSSKVTKKTILSNIAQVFDPLGLLSPVTVSAKILLQQLWREKISWDAALPNDVHTQWIKFRDNLSTLNSIRIGRQVLPIDCAQVELHGFSDASEKAYGACVFARCTNGDGQYKVSLIAAKTKVAPLKATTIPRLELCGAVVAAGLLKKVQNALGISIQRSIYWTDSTIVLGWIKSASNSLQIFVANRVAEIQKSTEGAEWRHVPTKENPADLLTKGIKPEQLHYLSLWWNGPEFLSQNESYWPSTQFDIPALPELKGHLTTSLVTTVTDSALFLRFSRLPRLQRTVAMVILCAQLWRGQRQRPLPVLRFSDLQHAMLRLIGLAQRESFPLELKSLSSGESSVSSQINKLAPFLDSNGIMRVGGRLCNSSLAYESKYPVLLSAKHPLAKLIFVEEHILLLHAGPQHLLASARQRFWVLAGRGLAKRVVHECLRCARFRATSLSPLMGNLPEGRVTATAPFHTIGVDYGGPISLLNKKGRGARQTNAYVALFICFVTKAIHLELVSDLTTEAFIAALRRFTSRRGLPQAIYSDNGTTFVGANKELKALGQFLIDNERTLSTQISRERIEWHFIPPYSPHFGGLWEAGIKSTKYHIKRVCATAHLTFEEFATLLTQIEAILNSRPITPLSSDPSDLTPLTPAHFLIGRPLTSVPDVDFTKTKENRLSRYQRVQQLRGHFWKRWHKEYLSSLQQRGKWYKKQGEITIGALVLIKEDNLPPAKWRMARVLELHPGKDGTTRVVSIRTSAGVTRRAVAKVCPLPTVV